MAERAQRGTHAWGRARAAAPGPENHSVTKDGDQDPREPDAGLGGLSAVSSLAWKRIHHAGTTAKCVTQGHRALGPSTRVNNLGSRNANPTPTASAPARPARWVQVPCATALTCDPRSRARAWERVPR